MKVEAQQVVAMKQAKKRKQTAEDLREAVGASATLTEAERLKRDIRVTKDTIGHLFSLFDHLDSLKVPIHPEMAKAALSLVEWQLASAVRA